MLLLFPHAEVVIHDLNPGLIAALKKTAQ